MWTATPPPGTPGCRCRSRPGWFAAPPAAAAGPSEDLTASERNVLRLMAQGLGNPTIAAELSISQKTVRNYVSAIFRKLQVADRAQAIVRARQAGLHR